jgi:hypothetical protein
MKEIKTREGFVREQNAAIEELKPAEHERPRAHLTAHFEVDQGERLGQPALLSTIKIQPFVNKTSITAEGFVGAYLGQSIPIEDVRAGTVQIPRMHFGPADEIETLWFDIALGCKAHSGSRMGCGGSATAHKAIQFVDSEIVDGKQLSETIIAGQANCPNLGRLRFTCRLSIAD